MEKERLLFSIGRFDHYYDSINNKCTVFLGLSTFIVGGLVAAYPTLLENVNCGIVVHLLMGSLLALGLAIMIIVAWTSTPFRGKKSKSLLYFNDIGNDTLSAFVHQSMNETAQDELTDLRMQAYDLSKGLKGKFYKLRLAGILMTMQFILFIPLIINIISYLKK